MPECTIRWRPSGGRGEYEVKPSSALVGRRIDLLLDELGVTIPTETNGTISQGKPRLRKDQPNNRSKLHLVPLVMAVARLPVPAREDKTGKVKWPLEDKNFVVSHMRFDIVSDDGVTAVVRPLEAIILNGDKAIDLGQRLKSVAADIAQISEIRKHTPLLADAIEEHRDAVQAQINSSNIRDAADDVIRIQTSIYGKSNTATVSTVAQLPPSPFEDDIKGKEGRVLTRLHSYKERDRKLVARAKQAFKAKHGRLYCECCGFDFEEQYGKRGEDLIQAHHITPVEELLPDSVTRADDLAMVCANCHVLIHRRRPWLDVEDLHKQLMKSGKHFF